jgi:hypothetical protein
MENLVYRVLRANVLGLGQRIKLATGSQLNVRALVIARRTATPRVNNSAGNNLSGRMVVWRKRTMAVAVGVGIVGPAGKVGIGDAGQKPPRSRRHALIVAREGAVAQSRKFVALNAERIPRTDRVRGKRAE